MKKPTKFGKYYLLERVNVGGMAEVFKAKSFGVEGFEKLLAIKRILPNIAEDEDFITMFIDEAKISVQLNHANIAQIFDLGKIEESYFIALEYVSGKDLRTIWDRHKKRNLLLPIPMSVYIMSRACEGLDYAHRKKDASGSDLNIVHRDISPQNVLISYEGEVKIIDFGIAKAANKASKTQAGILKGKFGYMSPEQVRGLPLDRRSDIFAAGIILYELLTGERLFVGESDFATLEKVRNVEILPPSTYNRKIPDTLEKIVLKALSKDPDDRFQSAYDMQEDLQRFLILNQTNFARKDLANYMKRAFRADIQREQKRQSDYQAFKPGDEMHLTEDVTDPDVGSRPSPAPAATSTPPSPMDTQRAESSPKSAPSAPKAPLPDPFSQSASLNDIFEGDDDEDDDVETVVFDARESDALEAIRGGAAAPLSTPPPLPETAPEPQKPPPLRSQPDSGPKRIKIGSGPTPAQADSGPKRIKIGSGPVPGGPSAGNRVSVKVRAPAGPPGKSGGLELFDDDHDPPTAVTDMSTLESPVPPRGERVSNHDVPLDFPGNENTDTDNDVSGAVARPRSRLNTIIAILSLAAAVIFGLAVFAYLHKQGILGGGETITIQVNPADAKVFLDGQPVGEFSPNVVEDISVGPHKLEAKRPNFVDHAEQIEVRSGESSQTFNIAMKFVPATLELVVDPPDATIELDGATIGKQSPLKKSDVVSGVQHELTIKREGYKPKTLPLKLEANATHKESIKLEEILFTLKVDSEPSGAQVLLDGEEQQGKTPMEIKSLKAWKTYKLEIKTRKEEWSSTIRYDGKDVKEVTARLEQKTANVVESPKPKPRTRPKPRQKPKPAGTGLLKLNAKPWGQVWIDGKDIGRPTPLIDYELPAGKHRITIHFPDGEPKTITVTIKPNETTKAIVKQ